MALPEDRMNALLAYCRIEEPTEEERVTLETLYHAAVAYMDQAGISQPTAGTPRAAQYDLCVNFMVLRDFDMRDAVVTGTATESPAFRSMLNQLKLSEPIVSNLDTGEG